MIDIFLDAETHVLRCILSRGFALVGIVGRGSQFLLPLREKFIESVRFAPEGDPILFAENGQLILKFFIDAPDVFNARDIPIHRIEFLERRFAHPEVSEFFPKTKVTTDPFRFDVFLTSFCPVVEPFLVLLCRLLERPSAPRDTVAHRPCLDLVVAIVSIVL